MKDVYHIWYDIFLLLKFVAKFPLSKFADYESLYKLDYEFLKIATNYKILYGILTSFSGVTKKKKTNNPTQKQ